MMANCLCKQPSLVHQILLFLMPFAGNNLDFFLNCKACSALGTLAHTFTACNPAHEAAAVLSLLGST